MVRHVYAGKSLFTEKTTTGIPKQECEKPATYKRKERPSPPNLVLSSSVKLPSGSGMSKRAAKAVMLLMVLMRERLSRSSCARQVHRVK